MCGIAGYISPIPPPPIEWRPRLQRALAVMALRGPDDDGLYFQPRLGLAHRRLAIIDLQGGRQPLEDPATGATIVFNGEIYNYRDLRTDLQAAGRVFHTRSDTEVLLHAYLEWGEKCLDRFLGMFAFAIHTPRDGALFLARDRLGIKPLFWGEQQQVLGFASSVRALLHLLPEKPALSAVGLSHYLSTIRVTMGGDTLLHGIHLLEPGHWMRVSASGEKKIVRYWTPVALAPGDKPQISIDEAAETTLKFYYLRENPDLFVDVIEAEPDSPYAEISSSGVKECLKVGHDISSFVSSTVKQALESRIIRQYPVCVTGEMGAGKSTLSRKIADVAREV